MEAMIHFAKGIERDGVFCGVPRLHKIWVQFSFANEDEHGETEGG